MEILLEGIRREMKSRGWSQGEFADLTGVSYVTISRYFNGKQKPSDKWFERVYEIMGKSAEDIVKNKPAKIAVSIPTDYSDPDEAMVVVDDALGMVDTAITGVIRNLKKTTDRMHFWQAVVEELPVPSLIIGSDRIVIFQNRKSREWGNVSGDNLCNGCVSCDCDKTDCAVIEAVEKGIEVSKYRWADGGYYKVNCSPFRNDGKQYFVVSATEINTAGAILRSYERMAKERRFLSEQAFELPEYYADADRNVTYINKSFGDVLGVDYRTIKTTDDLFSIITNKLFSPKKILGLAQVARERGIDAYSPAKVQGSNETLHFFFKAHIEDNELRGVYVCIMDQETYEFQQERGVL